LLFARLIKDVLQIRRLPAQAGAVIDDLAVNLARGEIDEAQRFLNGTWIIGYWPQHCRTEQILGLYHN
jgi:hypothetical protein